MKHSETFSRPALRAVRVVCALSLSSAATAQLQEIVDRTGDGNQVTLEQPEGLTMDAAGNVYLTGNQAGGLLRVTPPRATVTQVLALSAPTDVLLDASGNLYVTGYASAFRIAPDETVTQLIDMFGAGTGMFNDLFVAGSGIAVDSLGNVLVSDAWFGNVYRIAPNGTITWLLDGEAHALWSPTDILVDSSDNAYVCGWQSDEVLRVTPAGEVTHVLDATGDGAGNVLDGPYGLAMDAADNLYVTGMDSDNVFRVTPAGAVTVVLDAAGDGSHALDGPMAVTLDGSGNLYVAGRDSNNVFRVTPTGDVTQIADATGDGSGHALLGPSKLFVDPSGAVYVTGYHSDNAFCIGGAGVWCAALPRAAFRNAGTNPISYASTVAITGEDLEFSIDLTTTGHDMAMVVAFDYPAQILLGAGQTLLCEPGPGGDHLNTGFHAGPIAEITVPVPNNPDLIGLEIHAQALHAFGQVPFALSNARDIVIGGGCP